MAADPRTLLISEAAYEHLMTARVSLDATEIVTGVETAIRLARLSPHGPVTIDQDDDGAAHSDGWTIDGFEPLHMVFGPQAEQLAAAAVAREADSRAEDAYVEANEALSDSHGGDIEEATDAAGSALARVNADSHLWHELGGCVYGAEMLALAARDLIGTTTEWTQEAYDLLTSAYRSTIPTPLHPDDAQLPAMEMAR
ncbi:MAG: hypothetical protein J2P20_08780 [Pseudonocardia sp.]|nr:hypothetical protein [Pseudonocardia sp.]